MAQEVFIHPAKLAENPDLPTPLRRACYLADMRSGMTVTQFLIELTKAELKFTVQAAEEAHKNPGVQGAMSLFSAYLAMSEGLVVRDDEDITSYLGRLSMLVQAEILVREGRIRMDYRKVTLESFDKTCIELTNLGRRSVSVVIIKRLPPPDTAT